MGQGGDDDGAVLAAVHRPRLDAAAAGLIQGADVLRRRHDQRLGREVRPLEVRHDVVQLGLGRIEQVNAGVHHFVHVVRRDVGGHAHRDAGAAIEQQHRHLRREQHRLLQGAVEVGREVHRALAGLGEQQLGVAGQPGLGVAHGGEGLGVVRRAPIALAIHQGIAERKRLRHQHHGFVAGAVAMGMELAQHVAHGAGRLGELGVAGEAELAHGEDDAPLHGLQPIGDMRQGPVVDDVHGVVQVRPLGVGAQGQAFEFSGLDFHGATPSWPRGLCAPASCGARAPASWPAACP